MNKTNKYCLLFIFFTIFIVVGIWGDCFEQLKWKSFDLAAGLKHGNFSSFFVFKSNIDDVSNKQLRYHDLMMDVNSVKENMIGTKIIKKEDMLVVKNNDTLISPAEDSIDSKDVLFITDNIKRLQTIAEANNAQFLYCAAPRKEKYEKTPENVNSYNEMNYNIFLSSLKQRDIPFIDFTESLRDSDISQSNYFFVTDHHWKPLSGFVAATSICQKLNSQYGFEYESAYIDIDNYNIDHSSDLFLGSYGKKVGTFFTWQGADDFDLITPKFNTSMTEEQPFKEKVRNGSFKDTVLYMENMKKDYYNVNTYATYSGGDFRLQIIKNNNNPNGKKALLIRDSYACVVAPFLSLQFSELHICDVRNYDYYVGDKINVEEYIKNINPDYVMVLYSGVPKVEIGSLDFF